MPSLKDKDKAWDKELNGKSGAGTKARSAFIFFMGSRLGIPNSKLSTQNS
jgi:hypothetical protein